MLDWILDTISHFIKNGLSWGSLAGALILFLKNRRLKQYINRRLPRPLRDHEQDKLDYIIYLLEGGKPCDAPMSKPLSGSIRPASSWPSTLSRPARSIARSIGRSIILKGLKRMREYLKKLTKTKFQAFLIVTITNIIILAGYLTGNINLGDKVNDWMPAINLVVQLAATAVYQWVEGGIDKAAQQQQVYVVPGSTQPAEGGSADAESAIPDQPRK